MKLNRMQIRKIILEGVFSTGAFIAKNGSALKSILKPGASTDEIIAAVDEIIKNYDGDMEKVGEEITALSGDLSSLVDGLSFLLPDNPGVSVEAFGTIIKRLKEKGLTDAKVEELKNAIIELTAMVAKKRPQSSLAQNLEDSTNKIKQISEGEVRNIIRGKLTALIRESVAPLPTDIQIDDAYEVLLKEGMTRVEERVAEYAHECMKSERKLPLRTYPDRVQACVKQKLAQNAPEIAMEVVGAVLFKFFAILIELTGIQIPVDLDIPGIPDIPGLPDIDVSDIPDLGGVIEDLPSPEEVDVDDVLNRLPRLPSF